MFQNTVTSRRPEVANFTDIIKIAMTLIKTTFRRSIKYQKKKEEKFALKGDWIFHFLLQQKLSISGEKCWFLDKSRGSHVIYIFLYWFFIFVVLVPNFALNPWAATKNLILNMVNILDISMVYWSCVVENRYAAK